MAKIISVINKFGGQQVANPFPITVPVIAGTTASIKKGYLVITDGGNAGYWKAAPDPTDTDTAINVGVATSDSTETASADGTVTIDTADVMVVSVKAKTPGNLTAAKKGVAWILDVTTGDYTLDQGTSSKGIFNLLDYDDTTNGNCIALLMGHWRG
jgi:hypothetical protein